jgi:hypothetical protein
MFQIAPIAFNGGISADAGQSGSPRWFSTERRLPAVRRVVVYNTATAQRLGYIDETQRWRRMDGQSESEAVASWMTANRATQARILSQTD